MAKFAHDTLKLTKVAILVDVRNDYSVGLQTFFRQNFKQMGGEVVAEQSYSEGDSDFHAQLTQIKAANPRGASTSRATTPRSARSRARPASSASRSRCSAATDGIRRSSGRSAARR